METRGSKSNDKKKQNSRDKTMNQKIAQGILSIYFVVMTVIYPYYAPGGYLRIGEEKYVFFRNVTMAVVAVMLIFILCTLLQRPGLLTGYYHQMSVTDWFAYGYFVSVMLSYLCSPYKEEAFWGADGWHMGVVMQMLFVILYFLFSRYFEFHIRWLAVWLVAAAGVFLLGILNRYSVYPIVLEGQTPVFISTLGNINWFCGYWSVTAPMGMTLYWIAKKKRYRVFAGIYSFVAILAGIVQGSDSAYLVFATVYAALFLFSIHSWQRFHRWMELCILFAAACQTGRLLRSLPGMQMNYGSALNGGIPSLMERLTNGNGTLWVLCVFLLVYVIIRLKFQKGDLEEDCRTQIPLWNRLGRTGKIICAMIVIVLVCICLCGIGRARGLLCEGRDGTVSGMKGSQETRLRDSRDGTRVMLFQEDWGNGRGAAWNCSIEAYQELDTLHRIVGVGPDCFAAYIYEVPLLAKRLIEEFGQERLTNAHNEGLSLLINVGVLGFLCYYGFVGSVLIWFGKRADRCPFLYVCAVSLLAYTVHNMVSFQQVLSTPFFFILLGIGRRSSVDDEILQSEIMGVV